MMGRKRGSPYGLGGPNGVTYVQPNMSTKVRQEAGDQLAGYVKFRMNQTGLRYVGVLTWSTTNCGQCLDRRGGQTDPGDRGREVPAHGDFKSPPDI
jgi:hypothetical protein